MSDNRVRGNRVRIAFIGSGWMGQLAHLANYVRLRSEGECEIVGLTDLRRELADAVAEKYRVPRVYENAQQLLSDPSVDAVVCVQQWPNNYPLVRQVLDAGKSVITEKPMTGRLDEAEELAELARRRGVHYAVGFMKRYDPGVALAKALADDARRTGTLGRLRTVDALCNGGDWTHNVGAPVHIPDGEPSVPPPRRYPDSCKHPEQQSAYEYLINIFSHNVNLCHYFLGTQLEPRYTAFGDNAALNACLRADDVLVTIRGASAAAHEWREWTTLTFEKGELRIKTPTPMNRQSSAAVTLLAEENGSFVSKRFHAPVGWSFFLQARGFVRAVAGSEPLRAPAGECVRDVRVMERMIEIADWRR